MNNIVNFKNINLKLGGNIILNNLNFSIKKGEILGFLGQNGAGKSSTLKIMSGLIKQNSGIYIFDGKEFSFNNLNDIGAIINEPILYEKSNAYDNLKIFSYLSGVENKKQKFDELLDIVGLNKDSRKKKVGTYSTGMKQMLAIAISLVRDPKLLIYDEITSGLDIEAKQRARKLLIDLKNKGYSIIYSSHELEQIHKVSDRIIIISDKTIKFEGTLSEMEKNGDGIENSYLNLINN